MRKLIESDEGDVYGPMVCVIPLEEYGIKEHDIYTVNGMGNLEMNNDPSNRYRNYRNYDTDKYTYGYRISREGWRWIDSEGRSKISHYIPHDIVVTHFVYLMDHPNRESINALIRELRIEKITE